ncbi:MAG TPA: adenylyl-sulfate kinase [Cryomorphaceae bacterium]|nr:adenylyl-sulfate kinase [Cryomorphaceae bacterium]
MKERENNIFTFYDEVVQRREKEELLNQRAITIWMTGLSGSGKTTIAKIVERKLHDEGHLIQLLDGDNVRHGLNKNLSFTEADRTENIRRIAEVNKLFNECGIITINCFVSPTIAIRKMAQEIIGAENFNEVFVNTPLHICEQRDVKGLYKKARKGEIKNFTGIDSPFEASPDPALNLFTENKTAEESAEELLSFISTKIKFD